MSRKGNCSGNACPEMLFNSFSMERLYRKQFHTPREPTDATLK